MIGQQIEHYQITEVLGEGGMGVVYKAFDLKLERYVALKILNKPTKNAPHFIARFKSEAKNQAKLNHPNIVPIYGFVEDGDTLGIVMEYVDGETVEDLIQEKGRLDLSESLYILEQILIGTGFAHQKGFIHRDIKPSNVIISREDGIAKIMDFGISKSINDTRGITKTGTKLGTILYMSPEQVKAQEPTQQSDIYSIGITFYEMLCGLTPYDNLSDFEIMEAHLKKNPPKLSTKFPGIPSVVDDIIAKAVNKSLGRRYKDCESFYDDISKLRNSLEKAPKKSLARRKEKSSLGSFGKKLRFYFFAFTLFCILGTMFYFLYKTVSTYWNRTPNDIHLSATNNNSYRNNPSYKIKSDWKTIKSPVSNTLNSVAFNDDNVGFACGDQGTVIRSTDGGKEWIILKDSSDNNFYDVAFNNIKTCYVVGDNGTIIYSTDEGKNWEEINTGVNETLFRIYFLSNKSTGFIIGGKGTVLKTTDGGSSWNALNVPTNNLLYNVSFSNSSNGIIVGWNGVILKTTDGGDSWNKLANFTSQYLRDVDFINNNVGFIVGGGGNIFRTNNAGASWNKINTGTISGLYNIMFINNSQGIVLSNRGEILTTNNSGKSWKITSSGNYASLSGIAETPSHKIFIVGSNGVILTNQK